MTAQIKTPIKIEQGWLAGHLIRRARKPCRCQYWRGALSGGTCRKEIAIGDLYVEGEGTGETSRNGVLLQERYCVECAGDGAAAALPQPESTP